MSTRFGMPVALNEGTLRARYVQLTSDETSHRRIADQIKQQIEDLGKEAAEAGLGKVFKELMFPPPIPVRVEEETVRVRVLESFSGQWANFPYDAAAGDVVEVPRSYAKAAPQLFERVADAVPLFRKPVNWAR